MLRHIYRNDVCMIQYRLGTVLFRQILSISYCYSLCLLSTTDDRVVYSICMMAIVKRPNTMPVVFHLAVVHKNLRRSRFESTVSYYM
jgi:hypothetical protein